MKIDEMDKEYVKCCKNYLREWVEKYDAQSYQMTEEVLGEIIVMGGGGLRVLQNTFLKIVKCAQAEEVDVIDIDFINHVFSEE